MNNYTTSLAKTPEGKFIVPLVDIWNTNRDELSNKHVHQLIALAGDGRLGDGNCASQEFRTLLDTIPSSNLSAYARQCLESPFDGSGHALQDIVNKIGRRIGFKTEDGLYRGKQDNSGHDGIWELRHGHKIIVEVKTTDAYLINLDTIANYKRRLVLEGKVDIEKTSILIVVGRTDTGGLEAQIRGSRHAWDIRIISVEALIRLMELKESLDNPNTVSQISDILIPKEYTKLDDIIDLVFTTAEEVATEDEVNDEDLDDNSERNREKSKLTPARFHDMCIERIEKFLKTSFIKESPTLYWAPMAETKIMIAVSKEHGKKSSRNYWFAFQPHQKEELEKAQKAFVAFGCGSAQKLFLIPLSKFIKHLEHTWITEKNGRMYWHVLIEERNGKHQWALKKGTANVNIEPFYMKDV